MESIQTVLEAVNELKSKLSTAVDKRDQEMGETKKVSEKTMTQINDLDQRLADTAAKLEKYSSLVEEMEAKSQRPNHSEGNGANSLFSTLASSEEFQFMQKNKRTSMNSINVGGLSKFPEFNRKSISGLDSMRDIFSTLRMQYIVADPLRPNRIRDLFTTVNTQNSTIEWLREKPAPNGFTNASAPVAEGGLKPESSLDFELVSSPMSTIAAWIPITKQALNDLPMLEDHINRRLLEGLKEVEDVQLLYGSGVSANILGLYNQTGLQQYVQLNTETRIDAVRKAITKIENAYFTPDRVLVNPNDWQTMELTKDSQGRYLYANIGVGAERVLWRLPVVSSTAVNADNPIVGAFASRAATLYDHDQAELAITDSHSTDFIYNRYAIRLEERLTLIVPQPRAFCEIVSNASYN